ncbi:MAG: FAD-dependent oxidoreductase [Methanoregulaceae archaeon]|nr:FAD-dependent oxidoreductase [Methanoregulaceae archaeon]
MTTAVLGGGLTGVTIARLLLDRGEDVLVIEAEPGIGGLCRSKVEAGYTFDLGGSHIIFSRDREVLTLMTGMLGSNRNERVRNTKIFYSGRFIKYPFENGLAGLPKEDLFFCLNEYVRALIAAETGASRKPATFREWMYSTFGKGIAELYLVPYNEKIWKYPTDLMSPHWVEGRVPRPPAEDVIRSAIGIETEGYTHQSVFSYPLNGGIEALVHAVAGPLRGRIITGFRVRSLAKDPDGWKISDGEKTIRADKVICTIPVQALVAALPGVPDTVKEAVSGLRYNSIACVYLGVEGPVPDISWLYVPGSTDGPENRISFPSNYSPKVAPPGHGAILSEITYNEGDEISLMTDGQLISHIVASLERMGLVSRDRVRYSAVNRERYAYVVYDLPYQENIRVVRDYCKSAGIPLVGRFAQFEYLNMDACIRNAVDFVKEWT